jgi:hypothetical protein
MDIINHLLGTCGEFHPNLFTVLILISAGFIWLKKYKTVENK